MTNPVTTATGACAYSAENDHESYAGAIVLLHRVKVDLWLFNTVPVELRELFGVETRESGTAGGTVQGPRSSGGCALRQR